MGVPVHDVTYAESLVLLLSAIEAREPHVVTTPNPEIVMLARKNQALRTALAHASLNIPDGIGLVLAARLRGERLREHVQGTDVVLRLAQASPERGYRWFLLGGQQGVGAAAAEALTKMYPGLIIAGTAEGSPDAREDSQTRARIQEAGRIDVLLVAYGAPRQELWLERNLKVLGIPVGIGVGGVFNYLSGATPRAPLLVRRLHLEWLHRLITQPWRWRRQLALPHFAALALLDAIRGKLARIRVQPRGT